MAWASSSRSWAIAACGREGAEHWRIGKFFNPIKNMACGPALLRCIALIYLALLALDLLLPEVRNDLGLMLATTGIANGIAVPVLGAAVAVLALLGAQKTGETVQNPVASHAPDDAELDGPGTSQPQQLSSFDCPELARISHEMRTPLNAVIGFSQLMADEQFGPLGDARYQDYVRHIKDSAAELLDRTEETLLIAAENTSRHRLH